MSVWKKNRLQLIELQPVLYGESGIRTHGDISATLDFESSALDQLSHLSLYAVRGVFCLFLLLVSRFILNADTRLTNFMHR